MDAPPTPREPVSVTLADLVALVVGVALVLAADEELSWFYRNKDWYFAPRWLGWLIIICHFVKMVCSSLIPVVLARRFRYGGLARPAEFLAACCGLSLLARWLDLFLYRGWNGLRIGDLLVGLGLSPVQPAWSEFDYWLECLVRWCIQLAVAVFAAVAFQLGHRRLPGWFLTALLMIAWMGAFEAGLGLLWRWIIEPIVQFLPWSVSIDSNDLFPFISNSVTFLPLRFLFYSVPALVALRDLRRSRLARRSWLEWTGLGLAAILLLASETASHVNFYFHSATALWLRDMLFRDVVMLAMIALSIPIARRLGPAWSRLEMPRYTDTIEETGPTVS